MQPELKKIPDAITPQVFNKNSNVIIPEYMPERQSMPLILTEIMDVLNDLHPNAEHNCKLNILLAKIAQMVSFKRICFQEFENIKLINHYAINFMPSGMGKDKIPDDLDKFIFKNFILYFKDKARDYLLKKSNRLKKKQVIYTQKKKSRGRKKAIYKLKKKK